MRLRGQSRWCCQTWLDGSGLMIDPKPKLIAALGNAQEYLDLATSARDRGEREFYKRIAELYLKIAQELEAMMGE
jgi:hypothetical protein